MVAPAAPELPLSSGCERSRLFLPAPGEVSRLSDLRGQEAQGGGPRGGNLKRQEHFALRQGDGKFLLRSPALHYPNGLRRSLEANSLSPQGL